jgi:hypothetical protein
MMNNKVLALAAMTALGVGAVAFSAKRPEPYNAVILTAKKSNGSQKMGLEYFTQMVRAAYRDLGPVLKSRETSTDLIVEFGPGTMKPEQFELSELDALLPTDWPTPTLTIL